MSFTLAELKDWMMEGVPPSKVGEMPLLWRAQKCTLIAASVLGGLFSAEVFSDPKYTLGNYAMELENGLKKDAGINVLGFKGLNNEDWKTVKRIAEEKGELVPGATGSVTTSAHRVASASKILKKTTFKPLRGNRLKCNQTGEVMPARQAQGYVKRRENQR